MATLSRSTSLENAGSPSWSVDMIKPPSTTVPDPSTSERYLASTGPTSSHSLFFNSSNPSVPSRRSRLSDTGTIGGVVGRASLSMPPPVTKPASIYNHSNARHPSIGYEAVEGKRAYVGMNESTEEQAVTASAGMEELQKTTSSTGSHVSAPDLHVTSDNSDGSVRPTASSLNRPGDRQSFSSLYSLGSAIYNGAAAVTSAPQSAASSKAGSINSGVSEQPPPQSMPLSLPLGIAKGEAVSAPTTATDPVLVTASSDTHRQVPSHASTEPRSLTPSAPARHLESWGSRPSAPGRSCRSRSKHAKTTATSTSASSAVSPSNSDRVTAPPIGKVGVCALDVKARSKASRNILTRLSANGEFDVTIFGDKVILDEDVENWPKCDFLISFFSDGFPLDKAIAYNDLRKPFVVNDLPMQKILWDRRICLRVLDSVGVPTPRRVEVNRDGGPRLESPKLAEHLFKFSGVKLEGPGDGTGGGIRKTEAVSLADDGDSIVVDGISLHKPFVEKPISGEDHNIHIYFPKSHNGVGGRRLFRKTGNKSSEWDKDLKTPRAVTEDGSSYLYEQFLHVDNAEDIKAYTVGPDYCHAETRTSPVVDGLVRRNTHGKEIRYICKLTPEEQLIAKKIANGFGQRVCGFDMLRVKNRSFVIDVNGWSFVKDNNDYYDKCAKILKGMFLAEKQKRDGTVTPAEAISDTPPERGHLEKTPGDHGISFRKPTVSSHRSEFVKMLMRSPSMSKLRNHHPGSIHVHGAASPEASVATTSMSSPPTFENEQKSVLQPISATADGTQLPPPSIPTEHSATGTPQPSPFGEPPATPAPEPASKHSWKLKGMVSVIRHADRTPKQKYKFTFHTQPFVDLLKGHQEEVLLKGESALNSVLEACKVAMQEGIEDPEKLNLLRTSLTRKGAWTGTKVQIKPMFRKRRPEEMKKMKSDIEGSVGAAQHLTKASEEERTPLSRPHPGSDSLSGTTLSRFAAEENDLIVDKLQLVVKWGGEPTHSARYQSQDLGENMRADLLLMNKEALDNVRVFTSSEKRVTTSAQIWAASFLNQQEVPESTIKVRKDLLDDSNAAKDVMDKVKKELKLLLREGHKAPPQFAWPPNTPEPSEVVRKVAELMVFHRKVMRQNFQKLEGSNTSSINALNKAGEGSLSDTSAGSNRSLAQAQTSSSIQSRWCCGENPELFKERWEKLFSEFCDSEKVDPSKISELYDTMKFDALHNRHFLEWVFTPTSGTTDDSTIEEDKQSADAISDTISSHSSHGIFKHERKNSGGDRIVEKATDKPSNANLAQRMGLRRRSVLNTNPPSPQPNAAAESQESYFKLYAGTGKTKAKKDVRLEKLRELYKLAKVLFDFICPQEYGISNEEKLEIGLLTSLPLLKEIVHDLEEVQASEDAISFVYFTKESHIYTLLNCILEGGIKTKIERNDIPELDYLSNITFELYESEDKDADVFSYSIRISITPGCHTFDPLDVQLDSKHSIGCAPRRSLTAHSNWKKVIETLRAKFHTVKLPKSFLAVNVSESSSGEGKGSDAE
ncbi:MAG: hypothetical protein Q9217_002956 [Psora testacea]